jgi:hypothetical protein
MHGRFWTHAWTVLDALDTMDAELLSPEALSVLEAVVVLQESESIRPDALLILIVFPLFYLLLM